MDKSRMIRQLLSAPPALHTTLVAYPRTLRTANTYRSYSSKIPGVSQPTFWSSLIPKPFRRGAKGSKSVKTPESKEWNPATFYIVIFLLIGSMSIQMIALRNESEEFSRRADAKIELLRQVVERVQNGEYVDVESLLGTGKRMQERDWAQVLGNFQHGDEIWKQRRERERSPANPDPKTTKVDGPTIVRRVKSNVPEGYY